jgi:HEAT repeat protein
MELGEKRRQEAWERNEKARQEAWEKAEREHSELEASQKGKSDLISGKENMIRKEEPPPKALKNTKEISENLFSVDAQEAARELTYKNLASRLSAYKRFASQLKNIYELDKENAVDSIKPLLYDPDPQVRVYLAGGLSQLPTPEFADILLQLWRDKDANVRGESLRGLLNFQKRDDFTGIFPESLQIRIRQLVEQEKHRDEWVF